MSSFDLLMDLSTNPDNTEGKLQKYNAKYYRRNRKKILAQRRLNYQSNKVTIIARNIKTNRARRFRESLQG